MIQLYQTLDLRPIGIPQTLRLSQYDSDFEIIFELTNFDGAWILDTDTTAEVQGTKTDGHGYSADAVFDDQLKTVTIAGDVQMTAAAGRNVYEVVLFHDGDRLGSKNFILDVERAALDAETTASDSKIKNFTEMTEAAEAAAETATAAAEAAEEAAATFSTDTTLSIAGKAADAKATGDAIKEDLSNIGYLHKIIKGAFPNSNGVISAGAWDTYCYKVSEGSYIDSIVLGSASQQLIYAFYADEPVLGSVSYNNSRIPMGAGILSANRISIPTGAGINWIAVRVAQSDTPSVVLSEINDIGNAIQNDKVAFSFTDLNNADDNKIFYVSPNTVPTNYPSGLGSAYLATIPLNGKNKVQIVVGASTGIAYVRCCVTETWSEWKEFAIVQDVESQINSLAASVLLNKKSAYEFTDLNAITDNSIYYTSPNKVTDNYPAGLGAAYVQTIRFNSTNCVQTAYNAYGTSAFIRGCVNGSWSEWKEIMLGGNSSNPVTKEEYYETSTIALFPSVGCCGDSFTAGYLYNKPESQWYDPDYVPNGEYPQIGYPAVMGRLYGVDVTPYAKGGLTSMAYRTDAKGLPALLADDPKYLYIIALGLNDKTQNVPLGVEADIDTEPATATYLGNMGAIIRSIKNHAPYARIILCKSLWMNATYYNYISDGVNLLSSHLGIPYIETLGDPYFESSAYKDGLKGLHPTAPLYAGIGKRIGELVGKCVIDNPEYFYNFYVPNN